MNYIITVCTIFNFDFSSGPPQVCGIFCATANTCEVIVAESTQGRGIMGVIDGSSPAGVETEEDVKKRHGFLRMIGYKR